MIDFFTDDEQERTTVRDVPLEREDSNRPTVAMPPLFAARNRTTVTMQPMVPASESPGPNPAVPAFVAGYLVEREVGRGSTGVVYAASNPLIGKRVAIKVLSRELGLDPTVVEPFLREARALNALRHANIVETFDFGMLADGRYYLIMDLLVGESLRARLCRGRFAVDEATAVIDQCAAALAAAHAKSVVHLDVKPDNVYLAAVPGRQIEAKLVDFCLGKLMSRFAGTQIVGTPSYMSPEQARGMDTVDHRTDIYALGVLSYELLAGHLPYVRNTVVDTLIAHVESPIPSLQTAPSISRDLAELVEAMLAKSPEDRPTLVEVRDVLRRLPRGDILAIDHSGGPASVDVPTLGQPMPTPTTMRPSPRRTITPPDNDEPTNVRGELAPMGEMPAPSMIGPSQPSIPIPYDMRRRSIIRRSRIAIMALVLAALAGVAIAYTEYVTRDERMVSQSRTSARSAWRAPIAVSARDLERTRGGQVVKALARPDIERAMCGAGSPSCRTSFARTHTRTTAISDGTVCSRTRHSRRHRSRSIECEKARRLRSAGR